MGRGRSWAVKQVSKCPWTTQWGTPELERFFRDILSWAGRPGLYVCTDVFSDTRCLVLLLKHVLSLRRIWVACHRARHSSLLFFWPPVSSLLCFPLPFIFTSLFSFNSFLHFEQFCVQRLLCVNTECARFGYREDMGQLWWLTRSAPYSRYYTTV